jgi:hypothetical protein
MDGHGLPCRRQQPRQCRRCRPQGDEKIGSTDAINIIAQLDRQGRNISTRRFYLRTGGTIDMDAVASLGETNTGDPKVLEDFILWGAKKYPAQHYHVVIWNHGQGWDDTDIYRVAKNALKLNINTHGLVMGEALQESKSSIPFRQIRSVASRNFRRALFSTSLVKAVTTRAIALDDDAGDFLDNIELKRLFLSVKKKLGRKIDLLGMDACLMSMAEVMYQIRDSVMFGVGSEETEPGDGWPYDRILSELAATPTMTPQELSAVIVEKYLASYSPRDGVTQSTCDLSKSKEMAAAIDALSRTLKQGLSDPSTKTAIIKSRTQVQSYANPDYIHPKDFCKLLQIYSNRSNIKSACKNLIDVLFENRIVLSSGYKGNGVKNSHGLSIYFPIRKLSPIYSRLDLVKKTAWCNFLHEYIAKTTRR